MDDIIITITINDWRDVPVEDATRRRAIKEIISATAERYAELRSNDLDVCIKTYVEINE